MFTITGSNSIGSRREMLRIGAWGLGGLALAPLLGRAALAARPASGEKSVIFIHMHGGPSQYETFDPKMNAPREIRSVTGEIDTRLPGITFGSNFPQLARLADKFTVVRSFATGNTGHNVQPIVSPETLNSNLGSLYARVVGLNHHATGLPTNLLLYNQAIDMTAQPLFGGHGNFESTGAIGRAFTPFVPGATGEFQKNLRLNIPQERLDDRRALLSQIDMLRRELDVSDSMDAMDRHQSQAITVLERGLARTFDLAQENPQTVARYGMQGLFNAEIIERRLRTARDAGQMTQAMKFNQFMLDHGRTFGKQLLLARRLCEAGCGFVTVSSNFVWDMHGSDRAPSVQDGMPFVGPVFDHALATLIEDLEARGLSERVLVVCCGEMGRTPRLQPDGGRDHWGSISPLLIYGGGLKMGQVIGSSTPDGGEPASEPFNSSHLIATIMRFLFDVGEIRLRRDIPSDILRVITEGTPIVPLMS